MSNLTPKSKEAIALNPKDKIIVCDMHGKDMSSIDFSEVLNESINLNQDISFVIGGSFGLSE